MMKVIVPASLAIVACAVLAQGNASSDAEAIKQTALDYALGWYEGNAERMERALHPDLAKRALKPGRREGSWEIDNMSALRLVQATRGGSGTKIPTDKRKTEVTVLDVFGNAASVKLMMHDWIDYMHMSKVDGRWVVVNVLWELTEEAKKKYGYETD